MEEKKGNILNESTYKKGFVSLTEHHANSVKRLDSINMLGLIQQIKDEQEINKINPQ